MPSVLLASVAVGLVALAAASAARLPAMFALSKRAARSTSVELRSSSNTLYSWSYSALRAVTSSPFSCAVRNAFALFSS